MGIMAVIDMKKLSLIGLSYDKEEILKSIQTMGNLELTDLRDQEVDEDDDISESKEEISEDLGQLNLLQGQISKVESILSLLDRYNPVKKGLFDSKPVIDPEDLTKAYQNSDELIERAHKIIELEDQLKDLDLRVNRLNTTIDQMLPWEELDIPFEDIKDTRDARLVPGTIARASVARFNQALENFKDSSLVARELGDYGDESCYFFVYHASLEEEMEAFFREYAFSKSSFSGLTARPLDVIRDAEKELKSIDDKRNEIIKAINEFSFLRDELELLYDALTVEYDRQLAFLNLSNTDHTFTLEGWIPVKERERFLETIEKVTKDVYMSFDDPGPEEDFPVVLENSKLVEPFEMVTDLFSSPNPREIDPNGIMAPFYALFFGMMMGDAGYGVIMGLITFLFLKILKPKGDTKKLVGVIFISSFFTFMWGVIFGGWFGNAGEIFGIPPLWFSPSEEPIKMLIVCLGLGVVHIFAGMAVKAYANIKEGNIWAAIFDQGFWYVFYIGLILWLGGGMANLGPKISDIGKYMTIGGAVGLILTQGRDKKNIFSKLFTGIFSLYDVTGFLSDVLSYSRLFALALTTGIIGTIINQLGGMLGTSWYGWIIAAVVLIVGHLFNIAINLLGAFVHTSRLQYIEFYGKFYEGGGKLFDPLGLRTKYMDIK